LPAQGKSATCLSYRLWIRRDLEPHNGHSAIPASDRTAKIIESDESLTLSITNPLGTSDEIRIPARMALIPPLENRKLGKKIIRCESDPKLDADTGSNLGSDAYLMTASRIMLHRAIVLREGQFSRAHTFVV
jgi:hypothetical protein